MIDVHVPSNRMETLLGFIDNFEEFAVPYGFKLFLNLQFEIHTKECEIAEKILNGEKDWICGFIQEPVQHPSLMKLRQELHRYISDKPWMFFDCDDRFTKDSAQFYVECVKAMNEIKRITNRPAFCGTAGVFGSNYAQDRIHLSPRNALMANGYGIIFDPIINFSGNDFVEFKFDDILGGLEDLAFCATAISCYNAIPLKRFRCPTKKKYRSASERETKMSYIHDYDVWQENCIKYIQNISQNRDWVFPKKMGSPGTMSPKNYVKYVKDLLSDKRLSQFNLKEKQNVK